MSNIRCICCNMCSSVYIADYVPVSIMQKNRLLEQSTWWQISKNNWDSMRSQDRVLTLVLLGGVEVLPTVYPPIPGVMGGLCESRSPRHVMMTAGCLQACQVDVIYSDIIEVYEWISKTDAMAYSCRGRIGWEWKRLGRIGWF